ncbi:MAG: hypothetical protein NC218_01965 [Acetobacter sp.]|nr:hypothetical protein [Acetobacter sp.]
MEQKNYLQLLAAYQETEDDDDYDALQDFIAEAAKLAQTKLKEVYPEISFTLEASGQAGIYFTEFVPSDETKETVSVGDADIATIDSENITIEMAADFYVKKVREACDK